MNVWEVLLRLVLAMVLGALIGLEREVNGHIAGFRTHIIVCIGSALVMITGHYMFHAGLSNDVGRYAAQAISGIGFLGAGAIIKFNSNVRGLTTAACLWTTACLGLAIGAGVYVPSFFAALLFLVALHLLKKLESRIINRHALLSVSIFFTAAEAAPIDMVVKAIEEMNIEVTRWPLISQTELRFVGKLAAKDPSGSLVKTLMAVHNVTGVRVEPVEPGYEAHAE